MWNYMLFWSDESNFLPIISKDMFWSKEKKNPFRFILISAFTSQKPAILTEQCRLFISTEK